MERELFTFSIFYNCSKWHLLLNWLTKKFESSAIKKKILHISKHRGESLNFTIKLNKNLDKKKLTALINKILSFLKRNSSESNSIEFNGQLFKDFDNDQIYFGVHEEIIENYQIESFNNNLTDIKIAITNIILNEFGKNKSYESQSLGIAILIFVLISDHYHTKVQKQKISNLTPTESPLIPIICEYIRFAKENLNSLQSRPLYNKITTKLNIAFENCKNNTHKLKTSYLSINESLFSQFGLTDSLLSLVYHVFENYENKLEVDTSLGSRKQELE